MTIKQFFMLLPILFTGLVGSEGSEIVSSKTIHAKLMQASRVQVSGVFFDYTNYDPNRELPLYRVNCSLDRRETIAALIKQLNIESWALDRDLADNKFLTQLEVDIVVYDDAGRVICRFSIIGGGVIAAERHTYFYADDNLNRKVFSIVKNSGHKQRVN
jgi:hypothetical protein